MSDAGRGMTAGEIAVRNFASLAGVSAWAPCSPGCNSALVDASMGRIEGAVAQIGVLLWAHDVVGGDDYREAGELAAQTVEVVRAFLDERGLLERVPSEGGTVHQGEVAQRLEVVARQVDKTAGDLVALGATLPGGRGGARLKTDGLLDETGALLVQAEGDFAGRLLVLDVYLAELLEELKSPKNAASVRATTAEERGKRWFEGLTPSGTPLVPSGCRAVLGGVWAKLKAERARERLAHGVIGRRALGALQHSVRVGPNRPELVYGAGSVPALQLDRGVNVATVPNSLVQGLAQERLEAALRGAGLIATAGWNALLHKGVVSSSLRQWNGEQHPGLYRFAGYAGMTEALGLSSPKHRQALPDMLEFGELYRFDLGDGFEPAALWSHRVEKASGEGQGKRLEWNVNPWVYGADVRNLPDHADKALVFLSPQPAPMVLKASPNLSSAQWSFWWQFHASLMRRRAELFETGAMTLDASWWESVAEAAGWSGKQKRELLPKAIARYTADLVDQLLERVKGKPWVFTPGRSLEGVAEGLKKQEARFRGNSKGGKNRAKKREARMVNGWKPTPKRAKKGDS